MAVHLHTLALTGRKRDPELDAPAGCSDSGRNGILLRYIAVDSAHACTLRSQPGIDADWISFHGDHALEET